ncbi:MAG: pyridoxal phosphate-dependent decarboxylase family protein [Acidimicrobiales bacterium]
MTDLSAYLETCLASNGKWQDTFGPYTRHLSVEVDAAAMEAALGDLGDRLTDNYPFFHPRYAGQMLKPPHAVAVAGYLMAMLVNPNNHALDGGPATAEMEVEAISALAQMFGLPEHLGHLTSSGTIANLEALFVARSTHPGKGVAYGAEAHYTHSRMCHLLGMEGYAVAADEAGRMDLDAVADLARAGRIGTVVVTAGSTGLGAVDRVDEAMALRDRYGLRVHVDAAYGGYYAIIGRDAAAAAELGIDPRPWMAIESCDSVVVDPHKHGLQPYGCGAVLFADPSVARHYLHDSPYTYYTTADKARHLGEISLECSRAGAAAAALWLTLQLFPLTLDGLGSVLRATRSAAVEFASLAEVSSVLTLYQQPELDIVAYFPDRPVATAVDTASSRVFEAAMTAEREPVFLSLLRVSATDLVRRHPRLATSSPPEGVRLLRSVLMKP